MAIPEDRLYLCGKCKAKYNRADHLTRHIRGHMLQRPYACTSCPKAFARQDLLKRHQALHLQRSLSGASATVNLSDGDGAAAPRRVIQACRRCASKKLKCTDVKPCERCVQNNIPCDYETQPSQSSVTKEHQTSSVLEHDTEGYPGFVSLDCLQRDQPVAQSIPMDLEAPQTYCAGPTPLHGEFLENFTAQSEYREDEFFNSISNIETLGFSFLDSMDPWTTNTCGSQNTTESVISGVAVGSQAYQRPLLTGWHPASNENGGTEYPNLLLPDDTSGEMQLKHRLLVDTLSVAARDQILSMILDISTLPNRGRIASCFPSAPTLTNLIHCAFLNMMERKINDFIHLPTFKINEQRPELLGALIAAGAIHSPVSSVVLFGYAMQEVVRVTIQLRFEENNATLRDLSMAQAFYIQLDLAIWSVNGRKLEIAEASAMMGATILRRGKHYSKRSSEPLATLGAEIDIDLHATWLGWARRESVTRLAYFAFILDAYLSIARNINPVFSYAEFKAPLPLAVEAWQSATAAEWKKTITDPPMDAADQQSLSEAMRDLRLPRSRPLIDRYLASTIMLAALWTLTREYRQLGIVAGETNTWSTFVLDSRRAELRKTLRGLAMELQDQFDAFGEMQLFYQVCCMHLHVSVEELHTYAGKHSQQEAFQANESVKRWFHSQDSGYAIWHAGQVIKAAKSLPQHTLRNIHPVIVFQAAIVLGVYGLMWRIDPAVDKAEIEGSTPAHLHLDGDDSPQMLKFLDHNFGVPGLQGTRGTFVPLADVADIMDLVRDIVAGNWKFEHLPRTAAEVSGVIQGLGDAIRAFLSRLPAHEANLAT